MFIAFMAAAAPTPAPVPPPQPVRVVKVTPVTVAATGRPTPIDVRSWFRADDYPVDAQKAGKEGTVVFEVEVGPDGKPTACHIKKSSGTPSLDDATCKIVMERAHFIPVTVNGKAVASSFIQPTTWRLQGGVPSNGYVTIILDYPKTGGQPACSVIQKGAIAVPPCDQFLSHYGSFGKTEGLTKFVELLSATLGDAEPYRGEADWGRRYSFTSVDLYLTKDGKRSCVVVAATGDVPDPAPCASSGATAVLSDEEKKAATKQHLERSMFAVVRKNGSSGICKTDDAERAACN